MMLIPLLLQAAAASAATAPALPPVPARIERLLTRTPVIDGHNDLPWEIRESYDAKVETLDLTRDTATLPVPLQTDIPRLRKGKVGGQFWSVYIPATATGPRAVEMTLEEIDIVRRMTAAHPDTFAMAATAADVRRVQKAGRIASLIGVEGGHQIDGRLSVLRAYKALGVGYMTLTHSKSLEWADSATDAPRANGGAGGLSAFGRQVVGEMNRIGMIVDVSHIADSTMAAVLDIATAPVMASHSSARAIDDAPRNIPDALLQRIGAGGGVVMVNFYPSFVSQKWRAWDAERTAAAKRLGVSSGTYGARAAAPLAAWDAAHPEPAVTVSDVADHVEHVAKVAGKGAVGVGGDFDGISGTGPIGLKGVDGYPRLFAELARREWSDAELSGLAQGNILRVMEKAEAVAAAAAAARTPPVDATARN